jgi:N-acetylglucosamine-6-sulfatase
MGMGFSRGHRRILGRAVLPVVAALCLQALFVAGSPRVHLATAQTSDRPNIVLVLTDDQRVDSLKVMPNVQRLAEGGMTLRRAIATNPLCCPSRATILTGRFSHSTGVYTNAGEHGGWTSFQPSESDTIATALDEAGYRTALIGKYLNGYVGDGLYVPPGWDRWSAIAAPAGRYYNYEMFDSIDGLVSYGAGPRDYSTDVIRRLSASFVLSTPADTPLFLLAAPYAPHAPFTAAPRHDGDFASAPVPLGPAVNEADVRDKPAYIRTRPLGSNNAVRTRARDQWESLLAVDQLVGRLVDVLTATGRIDDTLFIFTSDNSISNQEHRWLGKEVPYEESIRVPMVISYPGSIPPGTVTNALVSNVDLAPTIADFAGVPLAPDGVSMRPLLTDTASSVRDAVLLEHVATVAGVPTYCGVRTPGFLFARYATGEEELYDLGADPWQLQNVAASRPKKATELRSLTQSLCQPVPPGFSW